MEHIYHIRPGHAVQYVLSLDKGELGTGEFIFDAGAPDPMVFRTGLPSGMCEGLETRRYLTGDASVSLTIENATERQPQPELVYLKLDVGGGDAQYRHGVLKLQLHEGQCPWLLPWVARQPINEDKAYIELAFERKAWVRISLQAEASTFCCTLPRLLLLPNCWAEGNLECAEFIALSAIDGLTPPYIFS